MKNHEMPLPVQRNPAFTVFPAIDLRHGKVVRLRLGDPARQTVFSEDPVATAGRWIRAGVRWIHVVNLDGAFGEASPENWAAVQGILRAARPAGVKIQLGGGLRGLDAVEQALSGGVERVILGTAAVESPGVLRAALDRFGPQRVCASLDVSGEVARVRGWQSGERPARGLAREFSAAGLRWLVYTDIARDGMASGVNWSAAADLARSTGLEVIASGGASGLEDIRRVYRAGLAGVIVGRALYTDAVRADAVFNPEEWEETP